MAVETLRRARRPAVSRLPKPRRQSDWHILDARHNTPGIGRILIALGRDATDTAIATIYEPI